MKLFVIIGLRASVAVSGTMRWLLWILGLFALAVGLALALRLNSGYVLFVWTPYRAEVSLNLLLLLAVAAFALFYVLLRFLFGAIALPAQVREYRARRAHDEARAMLLTAVREFFGGRYSRAEKAAAKVMDSSESPALGAVLAARAAHELRHYEQRDAYIARAASLEPDDAAMRVITQAEMLLDQRRFQEALNVLKLLHEKNREALRLELKALQQAKNWEQTLPIIDQLEKRGVFDANQADQLRRYAHAENLRRKTLDKPALDACWQKIPGSLRREAEVAMTGAQCYLALNDASQAGEIIESALDAEWNAELVALYAQCVSSDTVRQIERAEKWLHNNTRDAALLLLLGKLCVRQELWGKAQSYLEASLSVEITYQAHLELAKLCEGMDKPDLARRHYRSSLDLAVALLGRKTVVRDGASSIPSRHVSRHP